LLYYLVAYLLKGSVLISLVEWLALFGAGIFLFKAAETLTDQSEQARQVVFVFYLLVAGLGFGGGYALFLVLPFLFYSLHIVTQYLSYPDSDKGFLRLGMSFALAFFLAPLPTALFVATIALALLGFNVAEHRFVHGLYQFFAAALGFSIVFYPLGYFTVLQGSFGDAISQTFYPLNAVSLFANNLLKEIKVSKAFIGANGIDGHNVTTSNEEEGNGDAIILNNAISKYIVADNSKFDSYSFYSFYRLDNLSAVVTDDNIATKVKEKYSTYVEIL